ncbi:MAG: glycosyltransferase family 2 protein [Lunatimonas sp.]|uniref:glycosyltransferase family 2 protein n=1 Tax=Lunatimonas sp. TaxID=2060141 RepID=UPI00263BE5C0|nr:glycosyltransferase family 2 protein [Lunatimonas sp.]MCC5937151.1 glycosyltransferase family 2 protein [Lunatimonas sp.]
MNNYLISIVVPCYNEAENILALMARVDTVIRGYNHEIILVNDGSQDYTQRQIELASSGNKHIKYLSFSRNFGHQAALKAGIDHANGDCIITIDVDMQKPPEAIPEMIALWQEGNDIVTAISQNEGQPSIFKRWTSSGYYRVLSWLADHKIIRNGADFRLIDRKVADIIRSLQIQNIYLRGICSWVGYKQAITYYREEGRYAGTTKYSLVNMLNLASNGITSFSIKPLRFALAVGLIFAFLAFGYGLYAVIMVGVGKTITGWASVVASVVFLCGVQLIVLGVIGEYIGKIYQEVTQRPNYLVSKTNISIPSNFRLEARHNLNSTERRPAMT